MATFATTVRRGLSVCQRRGIAARILAGNLRSLQSADDALEIVVQQVLLSSFYLYAGASK
ncbi:hypothetical protein ANCCAN_22629 [Ancylostoma caninum]|uniref:Uncharacterized protein n=1 Tax=Ancylostoma caninum TaxID=29170 RepID=A0A368FL90_ANCCA|nr:hypothetical protein ANCCAN_22629 [Ancylostoma caninum]